MHRVTPVMKAKEPRVSFVISFMTTDAFEVDRTKMTKHTKDPGNV